MSDISTSQQATALRGWGGGRGALLGILGWEKLLGAPPGLQNEDGERVGKVPRSSAASMGFTQA